MAVARDGRTVVDHSIDHRHPDGGAMEITTTDPAKGTTFRSMSRRATGKD
jgi:hypothetical protein